MNSRHNLTRIKVLDVEESLYLGGTLVTAAAPDLNLAAGAAANNATPKRAVKRPITGGNDAGGGILSWQNTTGGAITITRLTLDVTTPASAACSLNAGATATSGSTSSNNLATALDVHTSAGTFDNLQNPGASGKPLQKLPAGAWLTISTGSGASAGLAGNAYIEYFID